MSSDPNHAAIPYNSAVNSTDLEQEKQSSPSRTLDHTSTMAKDHSIDLHITTTSVPFKQYYDNVVKSPLLMMIPQELETPEPAGQHSRNEDWNKAQTSEDQDLFCAQSFAMQAYLNYDNGLERCMTGVPHSMSDGSFNANPSRSLLARNSLTEGKDPLGELASGFPAVIEVDHAELKPDRHSKSLKQHRGSVTKIPTTPVSSHSTTFEHSPISPNSSSSSASLSLSFLDSPSNSPQYSRCYASLHRQLVEAGLSGLSDGSNSILLYHRASTVSSHRRRINREPRARRRPGMPKTRA